MQEYLEYYLATGSKLYTVHILLWKDRTHTRCSKKCANWIGIFQLVFEDSLEVIYNRRMNNRKRLYQSMVFLILPPCTFNITLNRNFCIIPNTSQTLQTDSTYVSHGDFWCRMNFWLCENTQEEMERVRSGNLFGQAAGPPFQMRYFSEASC